MQRLTNILRKALLSPLIKAISTLFMTVLRSLEIEMSKWQREFIRDMQEIGEFRRSMAGCLFSAEYFDFMV
jgi:hypothetical protein